MSVWFGSIEIPEDQIFWRGRYTYALVNLRPIVPFHVLVCPLRQVARFGDLEQAEVAELMAASAMISTHVNGGRSSVGIQDGVEAGQSIFHVHVHVIPRNHQPGTPYEVDLSAPNRTPLQMREEAEHLRQLLNAL